MAAKRKPKVDRNQNFVKYLIFLSCFLLVCVVVYVSLKLRIIFHDRRTETENKYWLTNYVTSFLGLKSGDSVSSVLSIILTDPVTYQILYEHILLDFHTASDILWMKIQNIVINIFFVLSVLTVCAVCVIVYCLYKNKKYVNRARRLNGTSSVLVGKKEAEEKNVKTSGSAADGTSEEYCPSQRHSGRLLKITMMLVVFSFLLTIPLEFLRLYQTAIATKVAQMHPGVPAECDPNKMSFSQMIKSWLKWQYSWDDSDPCLEYHKALLVDPVLEVPPLLVLTSTLARCIVIPFETLTGGLGRSLRSFFKEIPAQWQPVILIILTVLTVLLLAMTFSYRIHLPFLFKFEPKTPIIVKTHARKKEEKRIGVEDKSVPALEDSFSK